MIVANPHNPLPAKSRRPRPPPFLLMGREVEDLLMDIRRLWHRADQACGRGHAQGKKVAAWDRVHHWFPLTSEGSRPIA